MNNKNNDGIMYYDQRTGLPCYDPKYLTENNLWDSEWLQKKYPERFTEKGNLPF